MLARPVLVSIHDVMEETLPQVDELMDLLHATGAGPVTLLVVPGRGWSSAGIDQLRRWQNAAHPLAGHGWSHRADRISGLYHQVHSKLLSADCAEHLAMESSSAMALMRRCHHWFEAQGLEPPQLYVPPAWAMGTVPRRALHRLPFRYYEYLRGVYDAQTARFWSLPLLGFEAKRRPDTWFLRGFNRINQWAWGPHRPLRIGIHPHDLGLALNEELRTAIAQPQRRLRYPELASAHSAQSG